MARSYAPSPTASVGLLLIRLVLATVLLFHGSQKLFGLFGGPGMEGWTQYLSSMQGAFGQSVPYPEVSAWLSACTEFIGGILILAGFLTRLAAIALVINFGAAVFFVHYVNFAISAEPTGMEYALTLAVVFLGLVFVGPGRISIDNALFRRRHEEPAEEHYHEHHE